MLLGFLEAAIGLGLLALAHLVPPTIYGAFSRREVAVTDLAVRAGTPAEAVGDARARAPTPGYLNELDEVWQSWMAWFTELCGDPHVARRRSRSSVRRTRPLVDHRLRRGARRRVRCGCRCSNIEFTPQAGLCIRSGYLALREIADFFGFEYDHDPAPDDPITITREEFDEVYERLGAAGLPVRPDRDQAWRDFRGWRVNYDAVLIDAGGLRDGTVRSVDVGSLGRCRR